VANLSKTLHINFYQNPSSIVEVMTKKILVCFYVAQLTVTNTQIPPCSINTRLHIQVLRITMSTYDRCAFGHASPSTWNAPPNTLERSTLFQSSVKVLR